MLSRRNWMMDFIGRALRKGLSDDPDWTFDSTSEMYSDWDDLEPGFAADSALSAKVLRPTDTPTSEAHTVSCAGARVVMACTGSSVAVGMGRKAVLRACTFRPCLPPVLSYSALSSPSPTAKR